MTNTNEILLGWASMGPDALAARLMGPGSADLEALLGPQELAELRQMARARLTAASGPRPNIVLLPGMMGSALQSVEGMVETLWINPLVFVRGQINLLELAEDGQADAYPQVQVVATGLEMTSYVHATLMLGRQARLFLLPYDWRLDVRLAAERLRHALRRWSVGNGHRRFTLLGHSMGGLVARAYLAMSPAEAETLVERVILLGSPAYGVMDAVAALISGNTLTQLADRLNSGNNAKRVVRSLSSVYQVLPPPPDLLPAGKPYPVDFDLFDSAAWGVDGIRQNSLNGSNALYQLLAASDHQVPIIQIAGGNVPTVVALRGAPGALQPVVVSSGPNSGDGVVPLWSATLPGAELYVVQQTHERLQKDSKVLQAVLDLAHGGVPDLPRQTALDHALPITDRPAAMTDVAAEAEKLRAAIEAGTATAADLEKLFFAR